MPEPADAPAPPPRRAAPPPSLRSEGSTEHLICATPLTDLKKAEHTAPAAVSSAAARGRLVLGLALAQAMLGCTLAGAGALACARGAALARAGAGLWAGAAGVLAGAVGALAGLADCRVAAAVATVAAADSAAGRDAGAGAGGSLLPAFLALSLLSLACAHCAAVLAATGMQRDVARAAPHHPPPSFQEELAAWSPVSSNIAVLAAAGAQCALCALSVYVLARRVCGCARRRAAPPGAGSADSEDKLVPRWLATAPGGGALRARPPAPPAPLVLMPAHPPHSAHSAHLARPPHSAHPAHAASTLGRTPARAHVLAPRYATLPPPPPPGARFAPGPLYFPVQDARFRRRRSPRARRADRRRRDRDRERDSRLTRSLERVHRQRRAERERAADADLERTYTGLDRAYAEQFIAVCDESRHAAEHEPHGAPDTS